MKKIETLRACDPPFPQASSLSLSKAYKIVTVDETEGLDQISPLWTGSDLDVTVAYWTFLK